MFHYEFPQLAGADTQVVRQLIMIIVRNPWPFVSGRGGHLGPPLLISIFRGVRPGRTPRSAGAWVEGLAARVIAFVFSRGGHLGPPEPGWRV